MSKVRRLPNLTAVDINVLLGVAYVRLANDEDIEDLKDPLLDREQCELDAEQLQGLGANTIRVYGYTSDGNHDGCMKAFADAGIYVWLDLERESARIDPVSNLSFSLEGNADADGLDSSYPSGRKPFSTNGRERWTYSVATIICSSSPLGTQA